MEDLNINGFLIELRSLRDSVLASKIRVFERSELPLSEMQTELGIHVLQCRGKFGNDHPYGVWRGHAVPPKHPGRPMSS